MSEHFEGYYYKHQKDDRTLCLIVGRTASEKFIQVITENFSKKVPFSKGNAFTKKGIVLNICDEGLTLQGKIRYQSLSPIKYDIMGPFRFFSMECRHGIISMSHDVNGAVLLNGEIIDFTGGNGYIEMDSGRSFPSSYVWIQANDFSEQCAVMASVAQISFCGIHFTGCICVIQYRGREYRLATYLGVRVRVCTAKRIVLTQGSYILDIRIKAGQGQRLSAPTQGKMARTIVETASCQAQFHFLKKGKTIFCLTSRYASFECEM